MVNRGPSGRFVVTSFGGEQVRAFVPEPLPPSPALDLGAGSDQALLELANRALGRLDGLTAILPDTHLFVYMYVRKEAVLSSQIEGTQSSLSDLLQHEVEGSAGVPIDDVVEVSSYVAAMTHGLARLRGGFPLSLRLLREIHGLLLAHGRGQERTPGEFRRSQNWIGGTRPGNALYVPPPPDELMTCLGALERFLHEEPATTPLLVKAALAHAQFETIHPFLDGNGRLGRLLITLLLCADGALSEPTLYLSVYFKRHRAEYYERLQRVRTAGEWEAWLRFFATGVLETSREAVSTARALLALFDGDRARIQAATGRRAGSALRVHEAFKAHPILSIGSAAARAGLSVPAATTAVQALEALGILSELTGRQRGRLFSYVGYLRHLTEEGGGADAARS